MWNLLNWIGRSAYVFSIIGIVIISQRETFADSDVVMQSPGVPGYIAVRPGKFAQIQTEVTNLGKETATGAVDVTLEGFPSLHFTAPYELKAGESRVCYVPILVPESAPPGSRIDARVVLQIDQNGERISKMKDGERVFQIAPLLVDPDNNVTLMLLDTAPPSPMDWDWQADDVHYSYELAVALRVQAGVTRRSVFMDCNPIPIDPRVWDLYDSAVLASDSFLQDASSLAAMQDWIMQGGRLWVMLDKVDPSRVSDLLGSTASIQNIDMIDLERVEVESTEALNAGAEDRYYDLQFNQPMRRVRIEGAEVTHTIRGWPAIAWVRLGRGEVLLTTLSAKAWLKSQPSRSPNSQQFQGSGELQADIIPSSGEIAASRPQGTDMRPGIVVVPEMLMAGYTVRPWVGSLSRRIFAPREPNLHAPVADVLAAERIGLPTANRAWIALLLGGFVLLLTLLALAIRRRKNSESFGWVAPIAAFAFAIPIFLGSSWARREVEEQVSAIQVVEASAGLDRAVVEESVAIYRPSTDPFAIQSQNGGKVIPSPSLLMQTPMNSEVADLDQWKWQAERWPAGIWNLRSEFTAKVPQYLMDGRFTDRGLELTLNTGRAVLDRGPLAEMNDVVLFWPPSTSAIAKSIGDGKWLVRSQGLSDGKSWIASTLLDDQQLQRQRVYSSLFGQPEKMIFPASAPMALGWSSSLSSPATIENMNAKNGQSLWKLLVRMLPGEPGEKVQVPGWSLDIRARLPDGSPSLVFRDSVGKWGGAFSQPTTVDFHFQVPAGALPLTATRANFRLRALAPERKVTISLLQEAGPKILIEQTNSTGELTAEILDEASLQSLSLGYLDLRVDIGDRLVVDEDPDEVPRAVQWRMESMQLDVEGIVPETSP